MATQVPNPWGFFAILDCSNCLQHKIQDVNNIKAWLSAVAVVINATPVGEPQVVKTGVGTTEKEGYAAFQLLDGNHISAKFVESTQLAYIDIFASTEFDPVDIETEVKRFFGADIKVNGIQLPRNAAVVLATPQ